MGFDERIANEPKVSYRDGHYYVFDGQHTIAARKFLNREQDLPIKCKVYFGMTEQEEAKLFAQQTGASASLIPGARMRALVFARDPEALAFVSATENVGLLLDFNQKRGKRRMGCIKTAFDEFKRLGAERYQEALTIILNAWGGDPESFRSETVTGVCRFIDLYHKEYDPRRLIEHLRRVDPLCIYREGRAAGASISGYKKYLLQVYRIYNGNSKRMVIPLKF
jgi:hypothetical protein